MWVFDRWSPYSYQVQNNNKMFYTILRQIVLCPLFCTEQHGEVQGRRREEILQLQGVPVVLHDIAYSAGRRRSSQESVWQVNNCPTNTLF